MTSYDARGNVIGRETTTGNTITVYDASGRSVGRGRLGQIWPDQPSSHQQFANHAPALLEALTISKIAVCTVHSQTSLGNSMSGMTILENVRRYRTIASLYRQTAAFRPAQKWSLLAQAYEFERLAIAQLEADYVGDGL